VCVIGRDEEKKGDGGEGLVCMKEERKKWRGGRDVCGEKLDEKRNKRRKEKKE
jgi:hypothetical protein